MRTRHLPLILLVALSASTATSATKKAAPSAAEPSVKLACKLEFAGNKRMGIAIGENSLTEFTENPPSVKYADFTDAPLEFLDKPTVNATEVRGYRKKESHISEIMNDRPTSLESVISVDRTTGVITEKFMVAGVISQGTCIKAGQAKF